MKKLIPLLLLLVACQKETIPPTPVIRENQITESLTIQHIGRPLWGAYYLKTMATGPVKVTITDKDNYYFYIIDSLPPIRITTSRTISIQGKHQFILTQGKDYTYGFHANIAGNFSPAPVRKTVGYIGDSITIGYTDSSPCADYAWLAARDLEHTQIAYPGITLVQMAKQYFMSSPKNSIPYSDNPDLIVINLGTNDHENTTQFHDAYVDFINHIRDTYSGYILLMSPFNGAYATQVKQVADMFGRVIYVDTKDWVSRSDTNDGTHPSDAGHKKIAAKLYPFIVKYLRR